MHRKSIAALAAACLAIGLLATACGKNNGNNAVSPSPSGTQPSSPSGTVDAAQAEALYKSNCLSCHGADMRGGVGPGLQHIGGELDQAAIAARIGQGGGGMPGFQSSLSAEQIDALAAWLSSKK